MSGIKLTSELLEGFSTSLLAANYDNAAPIPTFHKEMWSIICKNYKLIAFAAPRFHAKTTAITQLITLASALFRVKKNIVILTDTEAQGVQFLAEIKRELQENPELIEMFELRGFVKDTEKEVIVLMGETWQFRISVKMAGGSLRGIKWRGKRPDLVIGDDMENDEMVESPERRDKFRKWFLATLLPMLADDGRIIIVGTVLHADSFLEYCLNSKHWKSKRYEAHNSDFTQILWPEKYTKDYFISQRAIYAETNTLDIYSREYLNKPIDPAKAKFREKDFREISDKDRDKALEYYVGGDFAISKKTQADYTVFFIIGIDNNNNWYVVDVQRARLDSLQIVDQIFEIYTTYKPQVFFFEEENIKRSIGPFIEQQMEERNMFPYIKSIRPAVDKELRAGTLIGLMRAGKVKFDKDSDWYPMLHDEFLLFPRGKKDDQVDAASILALGLRDLSAADDNTGKFDDEETYEEDEFNYEYSDEDLGMDIVTGY